MSCSIFFFFQAEEGIRYWSVTGVQTCALPISRLRGSLRANVAGYFSFCANPPGTEPSPRATGVALGRRLVAGRGIAPCIEIGRASCRERVGVQAVAGALKSDIYVQRVVWSCE